jgi:hypothetical protein
MQKITRFAVLMFLVFQCGLSVPLHAQDRKGNMSMEFFDKTEIGTAIGFGTFKGDIDSGYTQRKLNNDELIFPFQTINGFIISGKVGIGLGLGVEVWKDGLFFPVFGHVYYDFRTTDNTFFAALNLGNDFGTRYASSYYAEGKGGLLFSIGAGYKMRIAKRLQFTYEICYRYQEIESHYTVYFDAARTKSTTVDEKFPYNFAGFKVGIFFR